MKHLDYSVVIATRNRPSALRLSIPRMLQQSREPAQLIVIDSSDDHTETLEAVREAVNGHPVSLVVRHSERGLTLQRNAGLQLVTNPVTFYPDDDSIWFPGTAEEILAVYERDEEGRIAAVCGGDSPNPPPDFLVTGSKTYSMRKSDRVLRGVAGKRIKLENRFVPDPARLVGRDYIRGCRIPEWFQERDVVPVEWMTGFRMSFRTEVIRSTGFNEAFKNYCLFEDIDASFKAWQLGMVAGARSARIFHYKSPERRAGGRRLGVEQVLNKAYVVASFTPVGHTARIATKRFAVYKILQYLAGARDAFGRERLKGAVAAARKLRPLLSVPPGDVERVYQRSISECF